MVRSELELERGDPLVRVRRVNVESQRSGELGKRHLNGQTSAACLPVVPVFLIVPELEGVSARNLSGRHLGVVGADQFRAHEPRDDPREARHRRFGRSAVNLDHGTVAVSAKTVLRVASARTVHKACRFPRIARAQGVRHAAARVARVCMAVTGAVAQMVAQPLRETVAGREVALLVLTVAIRDRFSVSGNNPLSRIFRSS